MPADDEDFIAEVPIPPAPVRSRRTRRPATRCSRPASRRRGFAPPARRRAAPPLAAARPPRGRCRAGLSRARCAVRADHRHTSAKSPTRRRDANASARPRGADSRSRSSRRACAPARRCDRFRDTSRLRMRLQFQRGDDVVRARHHASRGAVSCIDLRRLNSSNQAASWRCRMRHSSLAKRKSR